MNIGIVGLGLIGGSIAKSTKARTAHSVWGLDTDKETMLLARMCGAIDGALDEEKLAQCDLVLLALRPQAAESWVREQAMHIPHQAIVIDMCGVKRSVYQRLAPLAAQYGFSRLGRIAAGYRADFVILEGDPLRDIASARVKETYLRGKRCYPAL